MCLFNSSDIAKLREIFSYSIIQIKKRFHRWGWKCLIYFASSVLCFLSDFFYQNRMTYEKAQCYGSISPTFIYNTHCKESNVKSTSYDIQNKCNRGEFFWHINTFFFLLENSCKLVLYRYKERICQCNMYHLKSTKCSNLVLVLLW